MKLVYSKMQDNQRN